MKKINNYPMSLLSFMILTNNYSVKEKNEAYEELRRRFSVNGCNYDAFMEYEQEAINKRGSNLENYLIKDNPSGQELMQMYFNYVYGKEIFQHGNLLFSENLLCNSDSKNSFFTRALKIELNNIKKRIEANNYTNCVNRLSYKSFPFYLFQQFLPAWKKRMYKYRMNNLYI